LSSTAFNNTAVTALKRHVFHAMAVRIECLVESETGCPTTFAAVQQEFERLEQVFSRFRADSELSRLNAAGTARCSDDLLEVVLRAVEARTRTGGRFDPTLHDALVAAGYDRTFAALPSDGPAAQAGAPCGGEVLVDRSTRTISLGPGVHLDLGGIAKGYAAERACELLTADGPCLVNAGGDIAVRGAPDQGFWPVGVETGDGLLTLAITEGGVATSGRDYRHWRRGGLEQHHLIDPATGRPSTSDLRSVTVVAADAVEAEIQAKALFLAGERAVVAEAAQLGLPCVLTTGAGRVVRAGSLA
jgi:thiamine biosynthesis lipoprotein